ncbi:MAG: hypothetical protein AAGB97_04125 [Dehalococcoidia bacterium]
MPKEWISLPDGEKIELRISRVTGILRAYYKKELVAELVPCIRELRHDGKVLGKDFAHSMKEAGLAQEDAAVGAVTFNAGKHEIVMASRFVEVTGRWSIFNFLFNIIGYAPLEINVKGSGIPDLKKVVY